MRSAFRLILVLMFTLALGAGPACGGGASTGGSASKSSSGTSNSSSSSNGSSNSNSNGSSSSSDGQSSPSPALDKAVSMPSRFPPDVPIYRGARLTTQAQIVSDGKTTWTMGWETLDGVDSVGKWYQNALDQGDWTLSLNAVTDSSYVLQFNRKSNASEGGQMSVGPDNGRSLISLIYSTA
jgi:hypothetical protein